MGVIKERGVVFLEFYEVGYNCQLYPIETNPLI